MPTIDPSTPTHDRELPTSALLRPGSALAGLRSELLALDPRTLVPVNVDAVGAALLVLGVLPHIREHEHEFARLSGDEVARNVGRLDQLARAMLEADGEHRACVASLDVATMSSELGATRNVLLAEARSLIARRVIAPSRIGSLTGLSGYANLCIDVLQLVSLMKESWDVVEPETGLTMLELDEAEALTNAFAHAVGARDHGGPLPSGELRRRAFTLLAKTYDDARRMIAFLRWKEGDADEIAPSFFRGRNRGRRSRAGDTKPAAPVLGAAPGTPGAPPLLEG